jgi:hypothetical protein
MKDGIAFGRPQGPWKRLRSHDENVKEMKQ